MGTLVVVDCENTTFTSSGSNRYSNGRTNACTFGRKSDGFVTHPTLSLGGRATKWAWPNLVILRLPTFAADGELQSCADGERKRWETVGSVVSLVEEIL